MLEDASLHVNIQESRGEDSLDFFRQFTEKNLLG